MEKRDAFSPTNTLRFPEFTDFFQAAFSGKDYKARIMDARTLNFYCRGCYIRAMTRQYDNTRDGLRSPCEGCEERKENDQLKMWKRRVKDSRVLGNYIVGIRGIEDIILGFCGWEEGILKWLREIMEKKWRRESMEYLRGGKWWDYETYPLEEYNAPKIIEKMCEYVQKVWRPHQFAEREREREREKRATDLCLNTGAFRGICEQVLRDVTTKRHKKVNFSEEALHALQVASESFLSQKYSDASLRAGQRNGARGDVVMIEVTDVSNS